jgi:hypothetical protein
LNTAADAPRRNAQTAEYTPPCDAQTTGMPVTICGTTVMLSAMTGADVSASKADVSWPSAQPIQAGFRL